MGNTEHANEAIRKIYSLIDDIKRLKKEIEEKDKEIHTLVEESKDIFETEINTCLTSMIAIFKEEKEEN